MKVINMTRFTQQVAVRLPSGALDGVRISPQGRITLREGMQVDTRWLELNPNCLKLVPDDGDVTATAPAVVPPALEA